MTLLTIIIVITAIPLIILKAIKITSLVTMVAFKERGEGEGAMIINDIMSLNQLWTKHPELYLFSTSLSVLQYSAAS